MATFVKGDLWSELDKADLILVTTNGYVKDNGELVMGKGAAKEMATRFPETPKTFGTAIKESVFEFVTNFYGIIILHGYFPRLGIFQVKNHWRDPARLNYIEANVKELIDTFNIFQWERVAMNFPGIGNGRLKREEVLPIISKLPDTVFIYESEV